MTGVMTQDYLNKGALHERARCSLACLSHFTLSTSWLHVFDVDTPGWAVPDKSC